MAARRATSSGPPPPSPVVVAAAALADSLLSFDAHAALEASRFAVARSELFFIVSWAHPTLTAAFVAGAYAIHIALVSLGLPVTIMVAHLASLALVVAAVSSIANAMQPGLALPQPCLPIDSGAVVHMSRVLGDSINTAVSVANSLLTWADPAASLRALAYTFLCSRAAPLVASSMAPIATVSFAAIAAPLYLRQQATIDTLWERRVLPLLRSVESTVRHNVVFRLVWVFVGPCARQCIILAASATRLASCAYRGPLQVTLLQARAFSLAAPPNTLPVLTGGEFSVSHISSPGAVRQV